jgi:two-component system capsular synthesis sensor histidine kinase RcsC
VDRIAEAIVRRIYGESMAPSVAQQDLPIPPVRLSVLVAEDNPINQVTLSKQLERLNCTVALASDGIEALAEWDAGTYDVLLTDVNMPRMNGYELASALRAKGVTKPIIGVTANAMRDEEARCLASGMSAWLVKPIALRTLYQHLRGIPPLPPAPGTPEASGPEEALADLFYEAAVPAKYQALFFATMKTDLEKLEAAIAGADAGGAGSLLHRIKGAVVVLGMRKMAERLDLLERLVRKDALEKHVVTGIEEFIVGFRNYEAAVRASSGKDARPA